MASIGHIAVGMAAARHLTAQERRGLLRTMVAFSALSLLPDVDVLGFAFGVPYGAPFGHRGASHSIVVALLCGLLAAAAAYYAESPAATTRAQRATRLGAYVACVVASHGLLDAMTDGGKGIALLWPFTTHRFFFAWRPIPVAPIGAGFVSMRGLRVALVEALELSPLFAYALFPRFHRPQGGA